MNHNIAVADIFSVEHQRDAILVIREAFSVGVRLLGTSYTCQQGERVVCCFDDSE